MTFPAFDSLELVLSYNHPEGLQWRDNELYIGSDNENDVVSVDPDGTQHILFVGGGPSDFALDGDNLFVAEQGGNLIMHTAVGRRRYADPARIWRLGTVGDRSDPDGDLLGRILRKQARHARALIAPVLTGR